MKDIALQDIRVIALLGHTGGGKTTLADAILHHAGVTERAGNPGNGTSALDYMDEEKDKRITVWSKPARTVVDVGGRKMGLTLMDAPGFPDFIGQAVAATAVADAALIVVDATAGLQVGTFRAWRRCEQLGLPRGIVVTGLDKENASFDPVLAQIQEVWGKKCVPVEIPTHDRKHIIDLLAQGSVPEELAEEAEKDRNALEESAAEENDAYLEKYLGGEHLTAEELTTGLRLALQRCHFVPVFEVEALRNEGIKELMAEIHRLFPSPLDRPASDASGNAINANPDAPFVGRVWKSINDPYAGQLSFVRVYGGTLRGESDVFNASKEQRERLGTLHVLNGRKDEVVPEATAGDIVALAKLKNTGIGDVLCAVGATFAFKPIDFPAPIYALAVTPKTQGDDDKISLGLSRVAEEDPTLRVARNSETHEMVISGMGEAHLDVAVSRMKKRSNVDVLLNVPKVAYKETITAKSEGHYRHKKQTGGRGQYGEVFIRMAPKRDDDPEWFEDALVGTNIPRNFVPAIEKGMVEGMASGTLAGFPVTGVKVSLYDGSHHEVDSSEIAFKIAASRAFTDAMGKARPVLLEPIMRMRIMAPDRYMGDITGDLTQRRGRVLGIEPGDTMQVISAEAPQSEIFRYASDLRGITQGQGTFETEFDRYDAVPSNVAQKIIAASDRKAKTEED